MDIECKDRYCVEVRKHIFSNIFIPNSATQKRFSQNTKSKFKNIKCKERKEETNDDE